MGKTLSKILKQKVKVYIADVLLELENLAKFSDSVIFGYPRVLVDKFSYPGFFDILHLISSFMENFLSQYKLDQTLICLK